MPRKLSTDNLILASKETVSEALQYSAGLTPVWAACQSSGFFQILANEANRHSSSYQDETSRIAELYAKGLASMLKRDPNVLDHLSNADLAALAGRITAGEYANGPLLAKVYKNYSPEEDIGFMSWSSPRAVSLMHHLGTTPMLENYRQNWAHMSMGEKEHLAEHISRLQAFIYGYPEPDLVTGRTNDREALAQYAPDTNLITLNAAVINNASFSEFVATIAHEGDHAFQNTLYERRDKLDIEETKWLKENKLEIGTMTAEQLQSFNQHMSEWTQNNLPGGMQNSINRNIQYKGDLREMSYSMLMTADKSFSSITARDEDYRNSPVEQHAYYLDGFVQTYLESSLADRRKTLEAFADSRKEAIQILTDYRNDAAQASSAQSCHTIGASAAVMIEAAPPPAPGP